MKRIFVLAMTLAVSSPVRAELSAYSNRIQSAVVALYRTEPTGSVDRYSLIGTGFLVAVPIRNSTIPRSCVVLVTARHIVDPSWARGSVSNPDSLYLRLTLKSYASSTPKARVEFVRIDLQSGSYRLWIHHLDSRIDAVAVPITNNLDAYDVGEIPTDMFPSNDTLERLVIGTGVTSAGLIAVGGGTGYRTALNMGSLSRAANSPLAWESVDWSVTTKRVAITRSDTNNGASAFYDGAPLFYCPMANDDGHFRRRKTTGCDLLVGVQSMQGPSAATLSITPIRYVREILDAMLSTDGRWGRQGD